MYERMITIVEESKEQFQEYNRYNYDTIETKVVVGVSQYLDILLENLKNAERERTKRTSSDENRP